MTGSEEIKAAFSTPPDKHVEQSKNAVEKIFELAKAKCDFYKTEDGRAFVSYYSSPTVQEHWPISSKEFQYTLRYWYFSNYKKMAKQESLKEVCQTLAGLALFEGDTRQVYIRTAFVDGKWYIDLCNDKWQVVEITAEGWRILDQSPVPFIRAKTMKAFPTPVRGGDINELWRFVNIPKNCQLLVLGWIVDALRQDTQKPVLELLGDHGSGKSHLTEMVRSLTDPSTAPLRNLPDSEQAFFVSCQYTWVVTIENRSDLSGREQDLLCQVSTGSAYVKRTSHSDADETVLQALRPQIINGITAMATRMDLIDRCVSIELEALPDNQRKSKKCLEEEYAEAHPRILGALFQLIADALKVLPEIKLENPPRLVDFGYMGEAVGRVMGSQHSFNDLLRANKKELILTSLETSPVCMALIKLCENSQSDLVYRGNYAGLLSRLEPYRPRSSVGWVTSGKGLANALKRHAAGFHEVGINLICPKADDPRNSHGKLVTVELLPGYKRAVSALPTPGYQAQSAHSEVSEPKKPDNSGDMLTERVI
ncbi:hypothetical protein [Parendozoicomonas haliclonae]|uniref:Uncharacterized protein n=1 Tax=Parendozoicomonas haliclonae TaxID=1960125 RepID=A0A1X7AIU0_9GAMM|nr:hypothetical protein [Parendozoicomonas haliclonae]SMA45535.1 hypothetical protein EHSB41UT_01943 [Parendozoicomonas haliclonae]